MNSEYGTQKKSSSLFDHVDTHKTPFSCFIERFLPRKGRCLQSHYLVTADLELLVQPSLPSTGYICRNILQQNTSGPSGPSVASWSEFHISPAYSNTDKVNSRMQTKGKCFIFQRYDICVKYSLDHKLLEWTLLDKITFLCIMYYKLMLH
jgi:hypothetical protein